MMLSRMVNGRFKLTAKELYDVDRLHTRITFKMIWIKIKDHFEVKARRP